MTAILHPFRRTELRAFLACWVLLAVLVRALVPVGYMPDFKALQRGSFEITVCTMDGAAKLLFEKQRPANDKHHPASGEMCPYGGTPVAALISYAALLALPFLLAASAIARTRYYFWVARLRTPLSPRAPPFM